jgi:hypothetical protein
LRTKQAKLLGSARAIEKNVSLCELAAHVSSFCGANLHGFQVLSQLEVLNNATNVSVLEEKISTTPEVYSLDNGGLLIKR